MDMGILVEGMLMDWASWQMMSGMISGDDVWR